MSWQSEREQWNKEGKCSREACQMPLAERGEVRCGTHAISGLKYCVGCTRAINRANSDYKNGAELLVVPSWGKW